MSVADSPSPPPLRTPQSQPTRKSDEAMPMRDRPLLLLSIVLLVALATVAFLNPYFSPQQWFMYTCILGLAAGGFAAFLPGALEWNVSSQLRASGALAMVVVVIWGGFKTEPVQTQSRQWSLTIPPGVDAPNPDDAVVYVGINGSVVAVDGTHKPDFPIVSAEAGKDIDVERGLGGLVVHVPRVVPGEHLVTFVQDHEKWWISKEIVIPPRGELPLRQTTLEALRNRVQ